MDGKTGSDEGLLQAARPVELLKAAGRMREPGTTRHPAPYLEGTAVGHEAVI